MRNSLKQTLCGALIAAGLAALLATPALAETVDAMLDSLQATSFQYFWNEANPSNGLIKDRDTAGSPCSIAAVGFGLSAICVGVDHGWVTRAAAQARVRTTLNTFWTGPQGSAASGIIGYNGLFYHFLDMNTRDADVGQRVVHHRHRAADGGHPRRQDVLLRPPIPMTSRSARSPTRSTGAPTGSGRAIPRNAISMGWLPTTGFSAFGNWVGLQRGHDPLHPGARLANAPARAVRVEHLGERIQLADPVRADLHHVPAAVRPPVLAMLARLCGTPTTTTIAIEASRISRTRGAPRWRSAPTRSPIRDTSPPTATRCGD